MRFSFKKLLRNRQEPNFQPMPHIEVAGAFDAFVSLEEIESNLDWMEVLAASWGVPCPSPADRDMPSFTCAKSPAVAQKAVLHSQSW
jgi:hypothetical protein